ncbi:restriction endonuclease subunit S [Zhenpiania hominis]|uniref:Restriction endonuclease subunit S n=1 Tax=Zhenpiania hominis TaxID=2763644 RepID=A0A923NIV2_9FIRM|nr:restriction endonuclease subunit S [Zhenpiania hominis]MBC6679254.1 restriction endonuclease subunit S [Zhenpiania hominis]
MQTMLLEDCCEILDSMRIPITAANRQEGPYPYYGANGIQDYVAEYIFDDELVLLAEDGGNFGSKTRPIAYRVSGKCWVNNHAHVLKPKTGLDVDFLCYSLMFYNTDGLVNGATRQKLTQATMRKMQIPDLPLKEQKEIVNQLNTIVAIKDMRNRELQRLDELIKARFVEMFGDPMTNPHNLPRVTLGSVLTIEPQNGLYKPQSDYVSDKTGVPILRIDSFYDGKVVNFSSLKRLICSEIELKRYSLYENDIVINRVNSIEYLGKCGLVQGLIENTVFESNMMRLHVDEHKLHPVYITKLLCSQFIYQQILKRAKKAVNQASINQKDVQSLVVYMPPIEQQERFAAFVAQTDKSKVAIQKSLDETQLLFDSLMQEYFG